MLACAAEEDRRQRGTEALEREVNRITDVTLAGLWFSNRRRGVSSLPPLNFPRHARKAGGFSSPTARQ